MNISTEFAEEIIEFIEESQTSAMSVSAKDSIVNQLQEKLDNEAEIEDESPVRNFN